MHVAELAERYDAVVVSATTGEGLDALRDVLTQQLEAGAAQVMPDTAAGAEARQGALFGSGLDSMEA